MTVTSWEKVPTTGAIEKVLSIVKPTLYKGYLFNKKAGGFVWQ